MKWLQPGELNHRITIQHIDGYITDEYGDKQPNWVDLTTVWANVSINSGREFWASRQLNAAWNGLFKIRYRAGITTEMRIVYGGRIFDITSVIDPGEAHREIHIEAEEVI